MKPTAVFSLLLTFFTISACAGQQESQPAYRFIVGFISAEAHNQAQASQQQTLQQWQTITDSRITFIRSLSGKSWVITTDAKDKTLFADALRSLDAVEYVEEDQVMQISPIERQPRPVRVH